jgi:hypothetical protein
MPRALNDVDYTIPDIQNNLSVSDIVLKKGQTVQVRRVVTYVYDVDMSEWLDANDEGYISVGEFVDGETENSYELENSDIEEDIVTMVTIL